MLTRNRNTPQRRGQSHGYPVAATTHIFAGGIVVQTAAGFAEPADVAATLIAVGVAKSEVDNSAGAAGDLTVEVERGVFRFDNSAAADEITQDDVGKACYLIDDETVALTDGTGARSAAGIIDHVDDVGVWVLIDPTSGILA